MFLSSCMHSTTMRWMNTRLTVQFKACNWASSSNTQATVVISSFLAEISTSDPTSLGTDWFATAATSMMLGFHEWEPVDTNAVLLSWALHDGTAFCYMLIMQIWSFICCQHVPVGDWPEWPGSTIVLAAQHCCVTQTMGVADVSSPMKNLPLVKFMLVVGTYSWHPSKCHTCQLYLFFNMNLWSHENVLQCNRVLYIFCSTLAIMYYFKHDSLSLEVEENFQ